MKTTNPPIQDSIVDSPGAIQGDNNISIYNSPGATINSLDSLLLEHIQYLKAELALQKEANAKLQEDFANKENLPGYKQIALELREEGKFEEAINSVDTDTTDEDAAEKHIFKAQLYIANVQFPEAETHYKQAAAIFERLSTKYLYAFAQTLYNMGNVQFINKDYTHTGESYMEALKRLKELAAKNPQAYLPGVTNTLVNLSLLYRFGITDKALSLQYAKEAIEVLNRCNDMPWVRELLGKSRRVIDDWEGKD